MVGDRPSHLILRYKNEKTYPLQRAIAQAIFLLLLTERLHLFFPGLRRGL